MCVSLRDLSQVTRGVDAYSAAVLETLLLKLKQLERERERCRTTQLRPQAGPHVGPHPDDPPPQGEGLEPDSVLTQLAALAQTLCRQEFHTMMLTLRTIIRNIQRQPQDKTYLTLRKTNPFFAAVFRHSAPQLLLLLLLLHRVVGFTIGATVAGVNGSMEPAISMQVASVKLEKLFRFWIKL